MRSWLKADPPYVFGLTEAGPLKLDRTLASALRTPLGRAFPEAGDVT